MLPQHPLPRNHANSVASITVNLTSVVFEDATAATESAISVTKMARIWHQLVGIDARPPSMIMVPSALQLQKRAPAMMMMTAAAEEFEITVVRTCDIIIES